MSYLAEIPKLEKKIKELQKEIDSLYQASLYVDEHMALDLLGEITIKKNSKEKLIERLAVLNDTYGNELRGGRRSKRKSSTRRKTAKRKSSKKTRK